MNGDNTGLLTRSVIASMSIFMSHQGCVALITSTLIAPRLCILWCRMAHADSVQVKCPKRLKVQHLNLILNDFCTAGNPSQETEHTLPGIHYINCKHALHVQMYLVLPRTRCNPRARPHGDTLLSCVLRSPLSWDSSVCCCGRLAVFGLGFIGPDGRRCIGTENDSAVDSRSSLPRQILLSTADRLSP